MSHIVCGFKAMNKIQGGWGDSHIKVMGVMFGNFEKNPYKVPESCLVGMVQTIFYPLEEPNQLTDIYFLSYFSAQYPKWFHLTSGGSHFRF